MGFLLGFEFFIWLYLVVDTLVDSLSAPLLHAFSHDDDAGLVQFFFVQLSIPNSRSPCYVMI